MEYDHDHEGNVINITEPNVEHFPKYSDIEIPDWLYEIDDEFVVKIYEEISLAIASENTILTILGTRALLDHMMVMKVGDRGHFKNKIDAYEKAGFITSSMKAALEKALDAGHAAMHRGHIPPQDTVKHIMKVIDVIARSTLLGSQWADKLEQLTPERPKRVKIASGEETSADSP